MEAITRKEKIMSGENLTPITRKELFLAKAAGQDVKVPTPITREEWFLSRIGQGGGGTPETPTIPEYSGVIPLGKYEVISVDGDVPIDISDPDPWFKFNNDDISVSGNQIWFFEGELWFFELFGEVDKIATIGDVIDVFSERPVTEEQFNAFFHYFAPQ